MTTNRRRPSEHGISRQTFLRGAVSVLATAAAAALPATRAAVDPATRWMAGSIAGTTTNITIIPFSAPDIPNPGRGFYNWEDVIDFPAGTTDTPLGPTYYCRVSWSVIQTGPSTYNWAYLDNLIATAASKGQRFGLRVSPMDPWNSNAVPSFLWGTSATTAFVYNGTTFHVPNYNDPNWISAVNTCIAALGARYNKDERFAWMEISFYGDWGEGDCVETMPAMGIANGTLATLGYWTQTKYYQSLTLANCNALIDAHIAAFPDTQLISVGQGSNYALHKRLVTSTGGATGHKPAGMRFDGLADNLSFYAMPAPLYALDPNSYYLTSGPGGTPDPFLATAMNQWKIAPIHSECGDATYHWYDAALQKVVNYPISTIASETLGGVGATDGHLATASKYSGYRYAVSSITAPTSVTSGSPLSIGVVWQNAGVAPTYDRWQITYQLRDSGGTVVASTNSTFNLKTLYNPAQGSTIVGQSYQVPYSAPLGASATDTASIATTGLAAGTYTVAVMVTWNEHKSGATTTWNYPPMKLAQTPGPNSDGSYPLVNVTLT